MTIHKEGKATLIFSAIALIVLYIVIKKYAAAFTPYFTFLAVGLYVFLISFFRKPVRNFPAVGPHEIVAPADGKVVVIEKVFENEYLNTECLLVSIFMSPLNVHINWYPNHGEVLYEKYHPGKYLAAWNPKSSTENERTTVAQQLSGGTILMRQVAGALARRIVCYAQKGLQAKGGQEMGFIKFGSRVDIYLPLHAQVKVQLNQKVTGCQTIVASL